MVARHKTIFNLPNELIATIIHAAPTADLVALCQTSRLFHDLAVPVLYRVVDVDETCVESFCSAILSNLSLAGYVRSFTAVHSGNGRPSPMECSGIMLDSLKAFRRVKYLWVDFDLLEDHYRYEFMHCTFPRLASWSLQMFSQRPDPINGLPSLEDMFRCPLVETLALPFLSRHPKLKNLSFSSFFTIEPTSPIPLSRLREFRGPIDLVLSVDSPHLTECQLSWWGFGYNRDVEPVVLALKSKIPSDRPFICSNDYCDGEFLEIIACLSRNIPHTKTLKMRKTHMEPPFQDMVEQIKDSLGRFSGLSFLAFEIVEDSDSSTEGAARVLAESFGDECPTLEGFCLNRSAWRKVHGIWEDYPPDDFPALAGITLS
ncbi:hypothetical protein B0H11DRAFT_2277005 [Mycena galericulata]|nr:hypothetical protein B0H11DRAFT_2277005 [Mycena galericulata]